MGAGGPAGVRSGCARPLAARFFSSGGPWSSRVSGSPGAGAARAEPRVRAGLRRGAHGRRTFAPGHGTVAVRGEAERFIFGNLPLFFRLLSTPCPLFRGTARPPHYGRGREEFQQHPLWHEEASGRRGGLTREELGDCTGLTWGLGGHTASAWTGAPEPPSSCPGRTRTAHLSRISLLPPTSPNNGLVTEAAASQV